MKKTVLLLVLVTLLISGNVINILADAVAYDMDPAGYYVYVLTPDGGLNMRSGPGTNYNKVLESPIPDYEKLYIEYTSGNWGYTSYNGTHGWVALVQTTTTPPAPQPAPQQPVEAPVTKPAEPTTPDEPDEVMPIAEPETEQQQNVSETAEPAGATENMQSPLMGQILLIAILVLLVVIIAILLIIIINMKSKK
ncbi:MAG: hypothetical protein IJE10_03820 [Clostridia bacterium]|nr:hypothetical protein [Clostridia bacterium]